MITLDIVHHRLHNQRISRIKFDQPNQVVSWFGAIQAQDYSGAKWAVAQRTKGLRDTAIEQAFVDGEILRTHILRPTWHFVTPTDIRWMLTLTASRVRAALAYMDRQLGLDQATFKKSNAALVKALRDSKQLTRSELTSVFQQAHINVDGLRLGHILMHAELDGIVCSGGRRGKQFTYALLDERAPQAKILEHDDALAELTKRYFSSHGPATVQDFVWWSGLTTADARNGLELIKSKLPHEVTNGQTYYFPDLTPVEDKSPTAYLLPNYDEYVVGYTDRTAMFDISHTDKLDARASVLAQYTIVIDGQVAGTWKRTLKKSEVVVELVPFTVLTKAENEAVIAAAQQYGKFLELPVVLA